MYHDSLFASDDRLTETPPSSALSLLEFKNALVTNHTLRSINILGNLIPFNYYSNELNELVEVFETHPTLRSMCGMIYPRWEADRYGVYMSSNIHDQQSPYKQGLSQGQSASRNIMRDYGKNLMTPLSATKNTNTTSYNSNTHTYSPNKHTSTHPMHNTHTHTYNGTNNSNNKHTYTHTPQQDKLLEAYYAIKHHNKYPYINNTYITPTYNNSLIHPYKHLKLTTDLKRDQTKRLIGTFMGYCILHLYCIHVVYCILYCMLYIVHLNMLHI